MYSVEMNFYSMTTDPLTTMSGSYSPPLVVLSVVLAMFASYAALDLAGRVTSARGRVRIIWLSFGAAAMGLGIWAMHYVGMLALNMPMLVFYHVPTVLISLLAAIAASAFALHFVSQPELGARPLVFGSVAMGTGIAAMHFVGMAAMRCPATIIYDRWIVTLSIALAIAISFVALKLAFRARSDEHTSLRKIGSALVMGSAIPLMHYTGMWAASFRPTHGTPNLEGAVRISIIGTLAIAIGSLLVLMGTIAASFFDRYSSTNKSDLDAARQRELYFRTMAEALPEIIWTTDPNGQNDYFNQKASEYTGLGVEDLNRDGWRVTVHPDDLQNCFATRRNALSEGKPYEVEYRLRAKNGEYRWFLGRANPVRDADGKIVKWFGTATDIENQKHNQQILEQQILERTMQLGDANRRLQEEMLEKDFARKELDQQNEKMMSELQKRSERATLLAKLGELLQSCTSRDEVFSAALGFAPRIFPLAPGAMALLNASRSLVEVVGSWANCRLPTQDFEATACWALRTGHPHLVLAGDTTAPCAHAAGVKHTYLCIPIMAQGETLGILHFQATDDTPQMEPSELSFKTTFAGQVGLSIANIRLREALRTQSVRDALTGLYNRRYLEEALERELRRAGRCQQTLGIIMLDLDHFKRFNDTYGHDAGDTVLREAAAFLSRNVRAEDFVCRYGGEEFVVILPTADREGARTRAERFRMKMRELAVMHQGKSLGLVTFSLGVAAFPENGTSPKELMAAADAALYEAKRGGRDQVVVAALKSGDEMAIPDAAQAASWS
jgi:diguanylate cyclase (GGDEF)-like protein/PAS domain S-box-containing protein